MKQNSRSVTLETYEAFSVGFDQLDHALEAFSSYVCDVKPELARSESKCNFF